MLFVSGLTLFNKQPDFSINVFIHRVLRLVLPVYIFMTIYFIIAVAIQSKGINLNVTDSDIIGTYLLLAGYVWIIRVFLIVGLLTPFLLYIRNHCSAIGIYGIAIITIVVLEVLIYNGALINNIIVNKYVYYGIGYSVPFSDCPEVSPINLKRADWNNCDVCESTNPMCSLLYQTFRNRK